MKSEYSKTLKLWDHGYVIYRDHLGNDNTPLYAARMSTDRPTGVSEKADNGTRDYLWRKGHVSVFEQAFVSVEVKIPIMIARQMMRHRGLHVNEFSMRYSEPLHEYYVPEPEYICFDDEHNKQSSGAQADEQSQQDFINDAKADTILNKARYEKHRNRGIAKERVRDFQPVNAYTKIWATANLRDWFFFLNKRLKPDAQREIQDLSKAIYEIIKDLFPLCAALFEEHTLYSEQFSKTEMEVLKAFTLCALGFMKQNYSTCDDAKDEKEIFDIFIKDNPEIAMSASRWREFKEKLELN